ncbi:hypothetical protein CAPTEDRAFT_214762 [Capitella teleta]|uniref:Rho-GAP domain-containing protein n=1 Tax=Capitella teleta TaxID=283909 RepID=R7UAD8_CAPTE|nr:hypothetical protein CAPTEDRAFT_214762 [Capitella teleta]|eukprot:ELU03330.1 hypothetical protein CAPTEDRAFT_214762 [Capitella teleta]
MALLLDHLKRVASKAEVNKMTTSNLAVCFGPCLLCPSPESALGMVEQAMDFKRHIEVLRYLLDIWPKHAGAKNKAKSNVPPKSPHTQRRPKFERSLSVGRPPSTELQPAPSCQSQPSPPLPSNCNCNYSSCRSCHPRQQQPQPQQPQLQHQQQQQQQQLQHQRQLSGDLRHQ